LSQDEATWVYIKKSVCAVDSSGQNQDPVARPCEHGNE